MTSSKSVKAILTDIEGTISDISFVKDVLFPYSYERIDDFVEKHWEEIGNILKETEEIVGKKLSKEEFIKTMKAWIREDKKITPLKELQGMIWEEGFKKCELVSHIYEDALKKLKEWKDKGIPVYVYSSGSVKAQKLFFSHTTYGDISYLFSGHFDTRIGNKKEPESYRKIAEKLNLMPSEILFLSDSAEEIEASHKAGMKAIMVVRDGKVSSSHPVIKSFDEIKI